MNKTTVQNIIFCVTFLFFGKARTSEFMPTFHYVPIHNLPQNWSFFQKLAVTIPLIGATHEIERLMHHYQHDGIKRTTTQELKIFGKFFGIFMLGGAVYMYSLLKLCERLPQSRLVDGASMFGAVLLSFLTRYIVHHYFINQNCLNKTVQTAQKSHDNSL